MIFSKKTRAISEVSTNSLSVTLSSSYYGCLAFPFSIKIRLVEDRLHSRQVHFVAFLFIALEPKVFKNILIPFALKIVQCKNAIFLVKGHVYTHSLPLSNLSKISRLHEPIFNPIL